MTAILVLHRDEVIALLEEIQLRNLPTPPANRHTGNVGATRESKGARPATVIRAVGTAPTLCAEGFT